MMIKSFAYSTSEGWLGKPCLKGYFAILTMRLKSASQITAIGHLPQDMAYLGREADAENASERLSTLDDYCQWPTQSHGP